ncbi:MAG: DUF4276 family protein [Cyanobium sp.]
MNAHLYIEGGGNSNQEKRRCREAFSTLLKKQGFSGRLPRLTACGGRASAYDDFKTALMTAQPGHFVALLIDSEDPAVIPQDPLEQQTWQHLKQRDGWERPAGASDQQVLLMTTCMETWIVADRATLREHYGAGLNENQLPATTNLESRHRHDVPEQLERATAGTSKPYRKGKRSFDLLAKLNPQALAPLLPSFQRAMTILASKL